MRVSLCAGYQGGGQMVAMEGTFLKASFPTSVVPVDPHSILDRVGPQFGKEE